MVAKALQPNVGVRAHIVAPAERREKLLEEMARPVFNLLEKGPLSNLCASSSLATLAGKT
jgi:hypothetical protein